MRNSNRPAGPNEPTKRQRDDADEREQVDDTLNPQAGQPSREGRQPTRNEPSPLPRNETMPGRDAG